MSRDLAEQTRRRLDALCRAYPDRHVGGEGNGAANALFAAEARDAGFTVEALPFVCVDWEFGWAHVTVDGQKIPLHVGPYSPPFEGSARLTPITTVEELEAHRTNGDILLIHGPLAAEQITPRNYPFYQMPEHQRILAAFDAAAPAAVIAATDRTPMAAALRPFPLFEDADVGFPSAYLLHTEVEALLAHAGETVTLIIDSHQVPARGEQIVARVAGTGPGRIAVSAHIDSRHGTPGALDNAGGVCVLLALADLLAESPPARSVELVPFNGEDNFAAYGEMAYLEMLGENGLGDIELAINIDAVGRAGDTTAISFYGVADDVRENVLKVAETFPGVAEGPEWPMSDHMVFAMRGVPALAITSTGLEDIAMTVAHTASDTPELVDVGLIVEAAEFIRAIIDPGAAAERPSG